MTITRNFKLCLNAGTQNAPYINVNQYDEGEQWIFDLYTEGGQKFTPSTGAIIGIKSDGNAILNSGTVNSDGQVVITETQQMTAASGLAVFELLIEGETHGTANFIVNVERRPSDDAEFSDSDLSMLQEAIDSAAEIEGLLDGETVDEKLLPMVQSETGDWLTDHITNPSNPPIDTSLTVTGAAADAKVTGDEITDLKSAIDNANNILLTKSAYTYQSTADKTLNTSGWTSVLSGYSVTSALPTDGFDYIMPEYTLTLAGSQRAVMFFTTSSMGTGVMGSSISVTSGELIPIPNGAHYVRFTFPTSTPPTINSIKANRLVSNAKAVGTELIFDDSAGDAVTSVNILDTDIFYITNYVNRTTDNEGKYLNLTNGTLSSNADYFTTDFIKVNPGDVLYSLYQMRFVVGYGNNAENTFVSTSTATNVYTYTVPTDVNYIRVTGYTSAIDAYIITKGFAPAEYAEPGTKLKPEYYEKSAPYNTVGGGRMSATAETLTSGTQITLDNFPKNLKKGVAISFCANFESFTSIAIGKGYAQYRGDWIEIDSANIVWKHYEESEQTKATTPHGLTISDFVMVALDVDSTNSATCHITITTKGGSASFDSAWEHEQNGVPFAFGGQSMTSVTLSAVASDIRCPMWLFGDSYFGVYGNRVLGQLIDIGYAENVLIDALAGQTPANALLELQKLMSLGGVPKFVVWTLGMNGTASAYSTALTTLEAIADKYGITLILYKVPTVPTRKAENNAVNTSVIGSGRRYIDAFKAVGDDTYGNWIDGYLSSDGVHPTSLGARAIAMRILVDAPEIMQYGYSPMDIDGNATGDL